MNYIRMFFNYLNPANLPEAVARKDVLSLRREMLLQRVLNSILILVSIFLSVVLIALSRVIISFLVPIMVLYVALAVITIARRINYHVRAVIVILTLQTFGVMALMSYGLSGTGPLFLLGAAVLASLFYNPRIAGIFAILSMVLIISVGYAMVGHAIHGPRVSAQDISFDISQWWTSTIVILFLLFLIYSGISVTLRGLNTGLLEQQKLTRALKEEQSSLERRVEERSADLSKRLSQFQVASDIAREIGGETQLEPLLNRAVNLIREQFGFYHVGVFLNDDHDEYAVLRSATGDAGRQMLERSHRLKIGEVGLVGYAISRGEPRVSLNVSSDAIHYKNPLLPETRSELALPMHAGARVIGALDLQSESENAFNQEDIRILQTIADQLAIAFEKNRLLDQLQRSVGELETSSALSIQKAWRAHLRNSRQRRAYRYHQSQLENHVEETAQAQEALAKGQPVMRTIEEKSAESKGASVLAVPIKLRNQVLGVVDIRFDGPAVSPDLVALIEGTVSRLAISLENARLLEEIQYRAERERLVSEISSKVRAAPDVDSVLRIAIQEIGQSLGVSEVMVQLRKD